jgi:osmoprotectant transport system substrate-binding protein
VNARGTGLSVLGALVLTAGVLLGLDAGAATAGHTGTIATRPSSATQTATASTTVTATIPEPTVTTVTQPTVPANDLPGTNRPTVLLGDMNTPEQFVIGQLYQLALESEGYTIQLTRNIGPAYLRPAALKNQTLDIYPEYLGEWNSQVAGLHRHFDSMQASYAAAQAYAHRHGYVLLPPTPFSDTSCIAVLTQYARANHVYSLPDLARAGPIILGAPSVFQYVGDGVPALEHIYHLVPDYVQSIGDGLQYWWLRTGNVDAAYCTTTDPPLAGPDFVQLSDPKKIFGYGNVIPVTTPRVVRVEGSAFTRVIERVDALLTQTAMRGLDAEIEMAGHNPTEIAQLFLQGNGILPPSRYAPVPTTTSTTSTSSDH